MGGHGHMVNSGKHITQHFEICVPHQCWPWKANNIIYRKCQSVGPLLCVCGDEDVLAIEIQEEISNF